MPRPYGRIARSCSPAPDARATTAVVPYGIQNQFGVGGGRHTHRHGEQCAHVEQHVGDLPQLLAVGGHGKGLLFDPGVTRRRLLEWETTAASTACCLQPI